MTRKLEEIEQQWKNGGIEREKAEQKSPRSPYLLRHLREQSAQRRESGGPCRVRGGWGCGCLLAEAANGACSSSSSSSSAAPLGDDDDRRRCVCARRARSSLLLLLLEIISVALVVVVNLEGSLVIDVGTGGRDSKLAGGHEDEDRERKGRKKGMDESERQQQGTKEREIALSLSLSLS